jgi:inosine-uridine nucleoside N-ribohydrolase
LKGLFALLGAAAILATGCGGQRAAVPVVVDTDMSTDDIVALLYVATNPRLDLEAVAVSGTGLTTCPAGARNALRLLALVGRGDVPVACGRATPLTGANQFPVDWRTRADAFFGLQLPPVSRQPHGTAVDLLAKALAHTHHATLLSLAPFTDTAELLRAKPALAHTLDRIVAMGGAVQVPGNVGPGHEHAEYNVWVDPRAAQEVFASGVPVTLVPLDATNDVPSTVFFSDALRRYHYSTVAATAVWDLDAANPSIWTGGQYFWDPLAAAAVAKPDLLTYTRSTLRVTASGRTVAVRGGAAVEVAVHADRQAFERELLGSLLAGKRFSLPKPNLPAVITFDGNRCTYRGPSQAEAGQVAFDTVNRGVRSFTYLIGERGSPTPELQGETPPHSRMTWVGSLGSGTKSIRCVVGSRTSRVATVVLEGAR